MSLITEITTRDTRFPLEGGAGSDAVHASGVYAYPVAGLYTDNGLRGVGFVLTLADGNKSVCGLIERLGEGLIGLELEALMATFGARLKGIAGHPEYRWLGPQKGVVHLALASLTNALFGLWAKSRGVPLWKLLLELSPEAVVALLDLSYLEDVLYQDNYLEILLHQQGSRMEREGILKIGYPGYDTSIGWFDYSDDRVRENISKALDAGFSAMKLKVGSADPERDIHRAHIVREVAGEGATVMLDCNQQWTLPQALDVGARLAAINPYWLEKPTHPDGVLGHQTLAQKLAPMKIACGEHVPNRVLFKKFIEAGALHFVQPDCTRLAGVIKFITVSLLARKYSLPVVPHVGDMRQIHQHLVLFKHIALGHEALLLEHIPHLRQYFLHPAMVEGGVYCTPQDTGASTDLVL